MHPATPRSPEEIARLGEEYFARRVRHALRPEDKGRFVAVDIDSGDFEADDDDMAAVARLRRPTAEVWLGRAGEPAAYRLRACL